VTILALDLSLTATGWAHDYDGKLQYGTQSTSHRGVDRLYDLDYWLSCMTWGVLPDLAVIEGYSYAARGSALFQIAEWGGVARLNLFKDRTPYIEVPPAVLKKYATGRGNATKPDMRMALYKRSGLDVADDNAVDAIWLLAIGRELVGDPLWDMPKTHVEALKKVALPEGVTL
jgi:Holliday junction resolvasome RuvABC endonuclease subunit